MSIHVLVTGDDEFPTWIPGALPIWTTFERVEVFIDVNQVVGQSVELNRLYKFFNMPEMNLIDLELHIIELYVKTR